MPAPRTPPAVTPNYWDDEPAVNDPAPAAPLPKPRQPPPRSLADPDDEREFEGDETTAAVPPDFVGSEYHRRAGDDVRGEFCPDWVIKITGSKAEMLVLSKIAYWFAETKEGKLKVKKAWGDRLWVYKTYRTLVRDLRGLMTVPAVRGAVRSLEASGVLISNYDSGRSPPKLYRINPVAVETLVTAAERATKGRGAERRLAGDDG